MRIISYIFAAIAAFNLLGLLVASNAPSSYVGDRLRAALMFGVLSAIIYYLQNKKEEQAKKAEELKATPKLSYWDNYVKHHHDNAMAIKALTKAPFSVMDDKDVEETIQSIEDWSQSIGCPIANLKAEFLKNFTKTYTMEEIKAFLKVLEEEEIYKEASHRQISSDNTCTNYMIIWLKEYIKQEEEMAKKKQEEKKKAPHYQYLNLMPAKQLALKENSFIGFFTLPYSDKVCFRCGSKEGGLSPALQAIYKETKLEDMYYAEVSVNGDAPSSTLILFEEIDKHEEEVAKAKEKDGKKSQLLATNRMTAKELMRIENAVIEFFQHPTSGKIFFVCGSKKGYVTPAVAAQYQTIEIDEMQYAEVSKDGGVPVPTLMMARKHNNIVRTIPIPDEFKDLP